MPSYKLHYFDVRGRAEVIRLVFAFAGKEFVDNRMTHEEWPTFKPNTPFGQMPVLEVDGQMMGQTVAICNFLAREFGLHGTTNLESCQIDQVVCLVNDFITATVKAVREPDEAKKVELMKNYREQECPKFLGFFENLLKKNGTGHFVGDRVTLADIFAYDFMWSLNLRISETLDTYTHIREHMNKIGSLPQIKAYVDARKPTEY